MTTSDLNTIAFVAYAVWVIGAIATLARTGALAAAFTWPIFWPCYAVWRLLRPRRKRWPRCTCPAPHVIAESCPLHGIGPGGNPELAAWANEQVRRFVEKYKPTPYSSAIGSRPPAPWVTREEFERLSETVSAFHAQARERILTLEDIVDQRPKPAPEPLAPGVRVWRCPVEKDRYVAVDGWMYAKRTPLSSWVGPYADDGDWTGYTELHGPERDEVVKDWMARKPVA